MLEFCSEFQPAEYCIEISWYIIDSFNQETSWVLTSPLTIISIPQLPRGQRWGMLDYKEWAQLCVQNRCRTVL